jgi:hypothetical protein
MREATSASSLAARMLRAMPRLRWNSPKRDEPKKASRRISRVHQSPTAPSARASEQLNADRSVLAATVAF